MDQELKNRLQKIESELEEIKSIIIKSFNGNAQNFSILQANLEKNIAKMIKEEVKKFTEKG